MGEILEKAEYCLSCAIPQCETGCPTGNQIRDIIKALKCGDQKQAADILYSRNPFPELTSHLCDCDIQCQGHCVRSYKGSPVQIQEIERYLAEHSTRTFEPVVNNGYSIAIIGSGPSALSAAYFLRLNGYKVTIFEKENHIGGAVLTGIPIYRFEKSALTKIQENLQQMGVQFTFDVNVSRSILLNEIQNQYDRVIVAVGAQSEKLNGFSAERGFKSGLQMLYDLNVRNLKNYYQNQYNTAVVWGGGNVAMDCARSLKRILNSVTIVYRRSEKEMPASKQEICEAKAEGIQFRFLENVQELVKDDHGKVKGAVCINMELGDLDQSGRASTKEIPGTAHELNCDLFVPAIGQTVDLKSLGLEIDHKSHRTAIDTIFVCGDAFLGPKTVGAAIKDGRDTATEIMTSFHEE